MQEVNKGYDALMKKAKHRNSCAASVLFFKRNIFSFLFPTSGISELVKISLLFSIYRVIRDLLGAAVLNTEEYLSPSLRIP